MSRHFSSKANSSCRELDMPDNGGHFPLPDAYFPEIRLTSEEIKNYESQMEDIVKNALTEYDLHETKGLYPVYGAPWTLVSNVEGLTTIKKETPDSSTTSRARIFGRINGNYRHFIDFFYAETSAELFAWNQFMFGYATDAAVLKNIHTVASKEKCLYLGIKWTCLNPSQLIKKRDNCYMEYLIYTKDLRGRDVGIRVTLPLDIPECPELPKKLRTKRIRLSTVWISRPADGKSNVTEFFMLSKNNFNGLAVTASYYKRMMNILISMAVFVDSRRILMQGVLARNSWAMSGSRKHCSVCSRTFGPTRRRHHCRLCGDLICRRCAIVRDAPKDEGADSTSRANRTFEIVKTKFCIICVTKMRKSRNNMLVPVPTPSGKVSVVNCIDIKLDDFCSSTISETESEGGHALFFSETGRSKGARPLQVLAQPAATFAQSGGKATYMSKLDVMDDQSFSILAEPRMTTYELNEEKVAEVIDTIDMMPISSFAYLKESGNSPNEETDSDCGKTSSGSGSSWPLLNSKSSPRSLDQRLAEQEELLCRMMLSASGIRRQNAVRTPLRT